MLAASTASGQGAGLEGILSAAVKDAGTAVALGVLVLAASWHVRTLVRRAPDPTPTSPTTTHVTEAS